MTSLKKDFTSEAALQAFAASLGPHLQAGDVLLLDGDLGAGKTSFTKGLAKGLGITDYVKSPTFTIIREYRHGDLLIHFQKDDNSDTTRHLELVPRGPRYEALLQSLS